jgi:N-acetylglucosaminyldiphosphoundecaprenol N-acetyl-beta-D-mannosaminyltransferase
MHRNKQAKQSTAWAPEKSSCCSGEVPDSAPARRTFDVLGTNVDLVQVPSAIERIERWISEGKKGSYVTLTNVHAVMEAYKDPDFKRVLNDASMVCPDGMPLIWLGRMHGHDLRRRVYGPELMWEFFRRAQDKSYSHFFYGGQPTVLEKLVGELERDFPGIRIAGAYSPPFRSLTQAEKNEVVNMINSTGANILWVGLGCPKQERWMHEHRDLLNVNVMLGVGQAFDIHAGTLNQAPSWMREHGLEWLFRLCTEPKRLWRRYLIYNSKFVLTLTTSAIGRAFSRVHS